MKLIKKNANKTNDSGKECEDSNFESHIEPAPIHSPSILNRLRSISKVTPVPGYEMKNAWKNKGCYCHSGKKFKKCCMTKHLSNKHHYTQEGKGERHDNSRN